MKVRRSLLKDTVTAATYTGDGPYGPVYDTLVTVRCGIDETRRLVRDSAGDERVSEATLTLHPSTQTTDTTIPGQTITVDPVEVFTPETLVTIAGRDSRVLSARTLTRRGMPYAVEVTCT